MSNVFVPLKISAEYPDKAKKEIIPLSGDNTNSEEEVLTIWNFLKQNRNIVLLGTSGSGKTTLLKYLTFVYASKEQKKYCEQAPELIPVLLLIREVSQKIVNNKPLLDLISEQAEKYIEEENQLQSLSQWFQQELKKGRCLIMLDGLDEVADDQEREKVVNWIKEQTEEYDQNSFILTSRPVALPDAYSKEVDIFLEVKPFNDKQVPHFIRNWYSEMGRKTSINETQAQEKAENLIRQIEDSSSLKAMAVNPLFLTMICTVHHKNRTLPEKPVDLYKVILEVLLEKPQKLGVHLSLDDKQSVLQILALKLMQKKSTSFDMSEGIEWIIEQLVSIESNDVTLLIQYFCNIGLIVEDKQQYQFCHLIFQQFLAAQSLIKTSNFSLFWENILNSWWEETCLLYLVSRGTKIVLEVASREYTEFYIEFFKFFVQGKKSSLISHESGECGSRKINQIFKEIDEYRDEKQWKGVLGLGMKLYVRVWSKSWVDGIRGIRLFLLMEKIKGE
ncbi:NACHT domain-containing protein [Calothrix sp. FACHB-1219]|uniref:NACHT domain-containing protein n=1 Tax=unclassified Calothrix TaxID=2619626 RepID=UPI0016872197|nr:MULTISPECIES: NACHT domain-containing protein [unclassified Calothrix]MBD2208235.1 NACHT domain-containing protein [Calothrix sp. FACHB-168]MBD2222813.1 NACHT domain-containing protein [Calothrix sp. FACHB-1219]